LAIIPYKFKVPNVPVPVTPVITMFDTAELVAVPNELVAPEPVTDTTTGITPTAVPKALVPADPVAAKSAAPVTTVPVALSVLSCAPIKA
jgi:hypothetical protein